MSGTIRKADTSLTPTISQTISQTITKRRPRSSSTSRSRRLTLSLAVFEQQRFVSVQLFDLPDRVHADDPLLVKQPALFVEAQLFRHRIGRQSRVEPCERDRVDATTSLEIGNGVEPADEYRELIDSRDGGVVFAPRFERVCTIVNKRWACWT